jgi:hypothetical protein
VACAFGGVHRIQRRHTVSTTPSSQSIGSFCATPTLIITDCCTQKGRCQQPRSSLRDARASAFTGDFGEVDPIQGVTIEDAEMLDSILSAGTFDDVREKVRFLLCLACRASLTARP